MSAKTTRTLVLGVAGMFEPANGYQLRRELLSWNVEQWANVNPGSIYSMLSTLARQGMLETHALPEGARTVTVYTITDDGRAELRRLIQEGTTTVDAMDPTLFRVALGFAPLIERHAFVAWLEQRAGIVSEGADGLIQAADSIKATKYAPPHVGYNLELEGRLLRAEREWLDELIETVRGGGLYFLGEPEQWIPPDGDEGWQMVNDIHRYREQLDLGARPEHVDRAPGSRRRSS
jgi:DNA-binding PadR family transcriptional regulator